MTLVPIIEYFKLVFVLQCLYTEELRKIFLLEDWIKIVNIKNQLIKIVPIQLEFVENMITQLQSVDSKVL